MRTATGGPCCAGINVCPRTGPTGGFQAAKSGERKSLQGRPLPTADVGYPVPQLEGRISGGEIAYPTGAGRPTADLLPAGLGGSCATGAVCRPHGSETP